MKSFNLVSTIAKNRHLLKPPVGNKVIEECSKLLVMAVSGPNARLDFHVNPEPELFFQLEGTIKIDIQEENQLRQIVVNEGDMFLLPAKIPHRPVRPENTIGIVVEVKSSSLQELQWFCPSCNNRLALYSFMPESIETDFLMIFKDFYNSTAKRTCSFCQTVHPIPNGYTLIE